MRAADLPPRGLREDVAVIAVDNLVRRFSERVVLDHLSLRVEPGERLTLRGPNGSGKTTLLRCIVGTLSPSEGTVAIGGHAAGTIAARQLTGASISQDRSFYLRLSGLENLLLFAGLRGLARHAARVEVQALIDELDLGKLTTRRADRCSTGQLQQLAVARALIGNPSVLLLDEPTRSLDADARGRLWEAVGRRSETAVLIATHLDEDTNQATRTLEFPVVASARL